MTSGKGMEFGSLTWDGKMIPSRVLPLNAGMAKRVTMQFGEPTVPYLDLVNAILHAVQYEANNQVLHCTVSSFKGHHISVSIIGRNKVKRAEVDGKTVATVVHDTQARGMVKSTITFTGTDAGQTLSAFF